MVNVVFVLDKVMRQEVQPSTRDTKINRKRKYKMRLFFIVILRRSLKATCEYVTTQRVNTIW